MSIKVDSVIKETEHILSTIANRIAFTDSMKQLERGEVIGFDINRNSDV